LPADARGPSDGQRRARQQQADLLAQAQNGDRAAYGQIVALLQDRLFNAMLRMVSDPEEARELTQESFTRGLENIDSFRGDASAYTWLFRIAMNLAISNLRKSNRHRAFSQRGQRDTRYIYHLRAQYPMPASSGSMRDAQPADKSLMSCREARMGRGTTVLTVPRNCGKRPNQERFAMTTILPDSLCKLTWMGVATRRTSRVGLLIAHSLPCSSATARDSPKKSRRWRV